MEGRGKDVEYRQEAIKTGNLCVAEAEERRPLRAFDDLEVYRTGFELAKRIFELTTRFPNDERYALMSQMRNASRSVPANIAEGWAKRSFGAVFKRHLVDALGSANEMLVWLDVSFECGYLDGSLRHSLRVEYESLARRLYQLHAKWRTLS